MHIVCPASSSSQLIEPNARFVGVPPLPKQRPKRGNLAVPSAPQQQAKQTTRRCLTRERSQQQVQQNLRRSARQKDRAAKTRAAEEAKKKNVKRRQLVRSAPHPPPPPPIAPPRHVYIGNLESSITLERLEAFFRPCGAIRETIIRCSRGQALNLGVSVPDAVRSSRDRLYASMAFYDFASVTRALALNRAELDGTQLVVSISPADMPEVADIALPRLQNIQRAPKKPLVQTAFKRLITQLPSRQDTLLDFSDPRNDKIRICGVSFNKCVM